MGKILVIFLIPCLALAQQSNKVIARQGKVAFFSYTTVEHIKAENNQVLSIIDLNTDDIAVSMLMNAFIFEKALMREHFNESYIESDIYPKANFEGKIVDFDETIKGEQTRFAIGKFSMHGVTKDLEIKVKVNNEDGRFTVSGSFETQVNDYNIKIPPLLRGNIAKTIVVDFNFEYETYEN